MYDVIFKSGAIGLLIWILLFATSTGAVAIAIRCFLSLRQSRFGSGEFCDELFSLLLDGDWGGAARLSASRSTVFAAVSAELLPVIHTRNKVQRQEIAVAALEREARVVQRQINILSMLSNIAPMLGLLGTVTGMVDAFMGLGTAMGPEKASILAISISQALYTTAAGLLIAIPAIALLVFFRNQLECRMEWLSLAVEKELQFIPEIEA